ncbi:hypothetical protein D0T53_08230 [Dysgonomonas sp. 216]|uniref:hypothetical protein n=1 Tax=Dysgonomonas sp. 216 TaxID=2302934 RepID=UPI0013D41D13|nr:hypothetical protein [Dysgonomonas sp. 216]NDW18899.1 hypothetical protein [Dysgonomonas sp. 216]
MKKRLLSFFAASAVCLFSVSMKAQTDVTSTYLSNAGFDESPNFLSTTTSSNLGSANGGANIQAVTGWTIGVFGDNSASSTFEYGYAGTLNASGDYGYIPSTGYDGTATGASLGLSAAWGASLTYYQDVTFTTGGKYQLEYTAYNSGPNATDNSLVGWVPASGNSVLSSRTSFPMGEWIVETIDFTVVDNTAGKIQVGISTPNSGSGSLGRIFIDYVKLTYLGIDKTDLNNKITEAEAVYGDGSGNEAAALRAVIDAATVIAADVNATMAQVLDAIDSLDAALFTYAIANASTSSPADVTSYIQNPSFEENQGDRQQTIPGWTKTSAANSEYCTRNDAGPLSGTFKTGNVYFQYWSSSKPDFSISQELTGLPKGYYTLKANAGGDEGTTGTFIYAGTQQVEVTTTGSEYTLDVTVIDGNLTIGFKSVSRSVNWAYADNFRLYYTGAIAETLLSVPSATVVLLEDAISTGANKYKFTVAGSNLTEDVTLSAPSGITLVPSTLTAEQANAGTEITATWDEATEISGQITATSGTVNSTGTLTVYAKAETLVPETNNITPNAYMNTLEGYAGWGHKSIVNVFEDANAAGCDGPQCMKIAGTSNSWPNGGSLDVNSITWTAGKKYIISFDLKPIDGSFVFGVNGAYPDPEASTTANKDFFIDNTTAPLNQWTPIKIEFIAGESAGSGSTFFNNDGDKGCDGLTCYFDNFQIYEDLAYVGISDDVLVDGEEVIAVKYYTTQGIEVLNPIVGEIYIVKKTYESQRTEVSKVIFK